MEVLGLIALLVFLLILAAPIMAWRALALISDQHRRIRDLEDRIEDLCAEFRAELRAESRESPPPFAASWPPIGPTAAPPRDHGDLLGERPAPRAARPEVAIPPPARPSPPQALGPETTSAQSLAPADSRTGVDPLPRRPLPAAKRATGPARNWEWLLGTRGLTWVGVGTLFLSFAFFLAYAIDQGWIGPRLRLAGVTAAGALMIGGGWWALRKRMTALGQGLLGGGFATWYLAVCAALKPGLLIVDSSLISPETAFVLLALVAGLSLLTALRWNMQAIAVGALIGGLAAPLLTATGSGDQHRLFGYLLVLDLGVLAAAWYRRWRVLDLLAFAGTVGWFALWFAAEYPAAAAPWSTLAWLGAFTLAFAVLPVVPHWRDRRPLTAERFALLLGDLAFGAGYAALMLAASHPLILAAGCFAAAGVVLAARTALQGRCGSDPRVDSGFLAVAIFMVTLGLFYLLPVNAVATGWALEAVLLTWLGYRFERPRVRLAALLLWLAAAGRTLVELPTIPAEALFLLNMGALHLLMLPAAAIAMVIVHRRRGEAGRPGDRDLVAALGVLAMGTLLLIGWGEWWRIRPRLTGPGAWGGAQWRDSLAAVIPLTIGVAAAVIERWHRWPLLRAGAITATSLATAIAVAAWWTAPVIWPLATPPMVVLIAATAVLRWLLRCAETAFQLLPEILLALVAGGELASAFGEGSAHPLTMSWFAVGPLAYVTWLVLCHPRSADRARTIAAALAWLAAVGPLVVGYVASWTPTWPGWNLRAGVLVAALLVAVSAAIRSRSALAPTRRAVLVSAIAALAWILLSCELPLWLWRARGDADLARLVLSLGWLLEAAVLLAVGFGRRIRPARIAALSLFALCAVKLLFVDLADSQTLVRIASFCITGLVLIAASWLYHRLERRLVADDSDQDTATSGSTGEPAASTARA